jgi:hypothetical protein
LQKVQQLNCLIFYVVKFTKGSLISEGILTLIPLPIRNAKSRPEKNLNFRPLQLTNKISVMGRIWHLFLEM